MREYTILLLGVVLVGCAAGVDEIEAGPGVNYLSFSPMYSAFDGVHEYAVTPSVPGAVAEPSDESDPIVASSIKWELDEAFVKRDDFPDLTAAIKLTMKKDGVTLVRMSAKTRTGRTVRSEARLTISKATLSEWDAGEARYNNQVDADVDLNSLDDCGLVSRLDLPSASACSNCHNSMSSVAAEHTPTQTAGYSNDDLIDIITKGAKPAGGTFNSPLLRAAPMPDCIYKAFHTWEMTEEEKKGIIWKIRSIPPKVQQEQ